MLGINSNINSLVAQQNLSGSQSALSQAITRLSSGKRINSAADDAAGLAISTRMQTQINGLNQGVSNSNDGVSIVQTASSALASMTASLQRIRTLAVQAASGSQSPTDQAATQQEVAQQIAEVNRIASQTTYNGKNILDGSAGNLSFQVGANVGQTINLDLSQNLGAATLGGGMVQKGNTLGTIQVAVDSSGAAWTASSAGTETTSINVLSDGKGGFTFTDQNNQALSSGAVTAIFGASTAGTGTATSASFQTLTVASAATSALTAAQQTASAAAATAINSVNQPQTVANLNISTTTGANQAMVSIDNALATINNVQASLGAAQNRFTAISTSQQAESTDLASAQSQITDANFAQETANLSKAQVLQQAGISVLAQANSLPQQVLKLLQ
ncbi:flagellin [Paraburkholderia dipogonis]|uniref:flagellin n=1 Tax=Paraburkholderia dipogonis TaxID=1211383 RepID=UPI0038B7C83E